MSWRLSPRQLRLYRDRVTIHRERESLAADGQPTPSGHEIVAADVPCYIQMADSVKGPVDFVVDEQDNLFTYDQVHFPDGVPVRSGDVLEVTAGSQAGEFYTARGDAKRRNLHANKLMVRCNRALARPAWVPGP